MHKQLKYITIDYYKTDSGVELNKLDISYHVFGQKIGNAPIVLVNHALTGNSNIAGEQEGWWKSLVGNGKIIDTKKYCILAFNIPGNGYDTSFISNYKSYTLKDIAALFIKALFALNITEVYAVIGASLGGGLAWQMAALKPDLFKYLIPVAADWKSTDWIIGHNYIQENILLNSKKPIEDARMMAMLFYRTPNSFTKKFNRNKNTSPSTFKVNSWLAYHGKKLEERYTVKSYLLMNHLLTTIDITNGSNDFDNLVKKIKSTIIQIGVDSDLFFSYSENEKTKTKLDSLNISNHLFQINSIHGHDAFLIEYEQLNTILSTFF